MISNSYRELWKNIPWKKLRRNLFRLQCRLWKAMAVGDKAKAKNLQKLILKSQSARLLAIRQVTQLNAGKKTAGIDGKASLSFRERWELESVLETKVWDWQHQGLRKIPIAKKDGTTRMLKIPTISDRAWQCLVKYALEPAPEATFHERSYGFRTGRSAHDCQKILFLNLRSNSNGLNKRILELDIEKCFDRINHNTLRELIIAPQSIKAGLMRCLTAAVNPEFPEQGTPQGGVVSPLLANIALNGIENIHYSVRYADDLVFLLKPQDKAEEILEKVASFLATRGLNIKPSKTRLVASTEGFDFLGWHFVVQANGKLRSYPSEENFKAFRQKVKAIINHSNYGAKIKAQKLAPIVRGWRNYHRYCQLNGSRFSLWQLNHRTDKVFLKEKKVNRQMAANLVKKALPPVPYSENKHINVRGDYSPFNGDLVYWSKRQSKLDDGATSRTLIRQNHTCGYCGLKFIDEERIHLHHIDRNHANGRANNLLAVHESCHDYIHRCKSES